MSVHPTYPSYWNVRSIRLMSICYGSTPCAMDQHHVDLQQGKTGVTLSMVAAMQLPQWQAHASKVDAEIQEGRTRI
jgi:hypothetical protein